MTQPVGEYSLDLSRLADPVGLALSIGGQHYRVIGVLRCPNDELAIAHQVRRLRLAVRSHDAEVRHNMRDKAFSVRAGYRGGCRPVQALPVLIAAEDGRKC